MMRGARLRPRTALFYAALTILLLLAIIQVIAVNSRTRFTVRPQPVLGPQVLLDAGHGGLDGGALSQTGVCEAPINLAVTEKTAAILGFCGVRCLLTRDSGDSLDYDPAATVRENKNADLRARLALMQAWPACPVLSIHLNQFPQAKYRGAQVFYSENDPGSLPLAEALQASLKTLLDPENTRAVKAAPDTVFLMKNAPGPAVTVECGFLSNPEECALLTQESYQTRLALAIAGGFLHTLAPAGA